MLGYGVREQILGDGTMSVQGGHVILSPFCGQRRGGRGCEKRGHPLAYFPHQGVPVGLAPTSRHLSPPRST